MSWSFSVPSTPVDDFGAAAEAALEEATPNIERYNPDGLEQAASAVKAATALALSGIVGLGSLKAGLSGHGNPGHVSAGGYAKEFVQINLERTDA